MVQEPMSFVFRDGKITPCDCDEDESDGALVVDVTKGIEPESWNIEATQWWSSEGVCRLTVNFFPLQVALQIFGEMVDAFNKSESDGETRKHVARVNITYADLPGHFNLAVDIRTKDAIVGFDTGRAEMIALRKDKVISELKAYKDFGYELESQAPDSSRLLTLELIHQVNTL